MSETRLILGDCCEVLPTIPSASVDVVLTDPPYPHIKREYGFWTEAEWFDLMHKVVPECMRVLKPTGSAVFILQPNSERVGRMRTWLWDFMSWVGKTWGVVQDAYWWNVNALPTVGATVGGLLRGSAKTCVWFGPDDCFRDQTKVLDQQVFTQYRNRAQTPVGRLEYQQKRAAGREGFTSGLSVDRVKAEGASLERGGSIPFNVLPFAAGNPPELRSREGHPAGTPEGLCDWWTRYLCPPGGTVLDPFAGSGTTGVAAVKRGCGYVGVERIPKYFEIAERRIAEAQSEHPLFAAAAAGGE
jgi:DNA modification methylase